MPGRTGSQFSGTLTDVQTPIRRPRYLPFLYVAAVVSLVAAGGVLLVAEPLPRNSPSEPPRDEITLTRCAAAVDQAGKSALYPNVSTWRPLIFSDGTSDDDRTVLGIATDSQPFFCEVTETTVTVSDPNAPRNYAAGSKTALLLLTKNGVAAGVVDPSWPAAFIYSETGAAQQVPHEGMFVHEIGVYRPPVMVKRAETDRSQAAPSSSDFTGGVELPEPAPPAVSVVDRRSGPVDRASELGRKLGSCLANSDQVVLDPDTYNPGARVGDLIVARSATKIGACVSGPEQTTFRSGFRLSEAGSSTFAFYPGHVGSRPTLAGTVPRGTTRMDIRFANGITVHPDVANGTFAVVIPPQVELEAGDKIKDEGSTTVWVYGANDTMTNSGGLQFWQPPTRR